MQLDIGAGCIKATCRDRDLGEGAARSVVSIRDAPSVTREVQPERCVAWE